jgi:transcriptional regulator with XRE-family HTH domain
MEVSDMTIGKKIQYLRERFDMKQYELAKKIEITVACLSRYENDIREPKFEILNRIAKLFKVDANFFVDYTNSNVKLDVDTTSFEKTFSDLIILLMHQKHEVIIDVLKYAELLKIKEEFHKKK